MQYHTWNLTKNLFLNEKSCCYWLRLVTLLGGVDALQNLISGKSGEETLQDLMF